MNVGKSLFISVSIVLINLLINLILKNICQGIEQILFPSWVTLDPPELCYREFYNYIIYLFDKKISRRNVS